MYGYAFFILYAFLGWICEDLYCGIPAKRFINRGFLFGPYCPIYGFGALLVIYPLLQLRQYPIIVFLAGVIITSTLEYVTSWGMEKLFHTRWWDYSQYKFNINGRVCLLNSTLFGFMALFVIYILHPKIYMFISQITISVLYSLEGAFTIGFGIDFVLTLIALIKRKHIIEKAQEELEKIKKEFEKEQEEKWEEFNENITKWLDSQPELEARLSAFNTRYIELKQLRDHRISKAFPDRKLKGKMEKMHLHGQPLHEFISKRKKR